MSRTSSSSDAPATTYRHAPHWGQIILGSLVTLALFVAVTAVGAAIFFFFADFNHFKPLLWAVLAGIGGILVVFGSFWAGGCVSCQFGKFPDKKTAMLQGVGVWGLAVGVGLFAYIQMAPTTTRIIGELGLTAGASTGATVVLDELIKKNIVVVSEMKIFEGKVVTHLSSAKKGSQMAEYLQNQVQEKAEEKADELSQPKALKTIETISTVAGIACLVGFLTLLLSAVGAVVGAMQNAVIVGEGT